MRDKELILYLRPPAKMYLGLELTDSRNLFIEGRHVLGGFPPWPASPDILYNLKSRIWVGVTYAVPKEYQADVRRLSETLDPLVVRYDDFVEGRNIESYGSGTGDIHSLEIIWAPNEADAFALAQLSDDMWYYTDEKEVIAFGMSYIEDTLKTFDLILPDSFPWPSLEIKEKD